MSGSVAASAFYVNGNNGGTYPSYSGANVAQTWNFSGGEAEANFWNLFDSYPPAVSFDWRQLTGSSSNTLLMTLNPSGNLDVTGTVTASGATVAGTMNAGNIIANNSAGGVFYVTGDNGGIYPSYSGANAAQTWNFSGGEGETNFWNLVDSFTPAVSFDWRQLTGSSSNTLLMTLSAAGNLNVTGSVTANVIQTPGAYQTRWTTAAVDFGTEPQSINNSYSGPQIGYALIRGQTNPADNGIYGIFGLDSTGPETVVGGRTAEFSTSESFQNGVIVYVAGTAYDVGQNICYSFIPGPGFVLGTTPISFNEVIVYQGSGTDNTTETAATPFSPTGITIFGNPSISCIPVGNLLAAQDPFNSGSNQYGTGSFPTYCSFNILGTAQQPSNREFLLNVGLVSNVGLMSQEVGVTVDKVAIYAGVLADHGSGDCWAINPVVTVLNTNSHYTNFQGIELDFANYAEDRAINLGYGLMNGLSIVGGTDHTSRSAVFIDGDGSAPMWDAGIEFAATQSGTGGATGTYNIYAMSNASTFIKAGATYTYGIDMSTADCSNPLLLPNDCGIQFASNGGSLAFLSTLFLSSSNIVVIGSTAAAGVDVANNFAPISDNTYDCGTSGQRWAQAYCVTGVWSTSDAEAKDGIEKSPLGLNFISRLVGKQYRWKNVPRTKAVAYPPSAPRPVDGRVGKDPIPEVVAPDRDDGEQRLYHGLIAQDVEQCVMDLGISFAGVRTDAGRKHLNYQEFIAPLINSQNELLDLVSDLIEALEVVPALQPAVERIRARRDAVLSVP